MEKDFERLSDEVVAIDGKLYRIMTDIECVEFNWSDVDPIAFVPALRNSE